MTVKCYKNKQNRYCCQTQ